MQSIRIQSLNSFAHTAFFRKSKENNAMHYLMSFDRVLEIAELFLRKPNQKTINCLSNRFCTKFTSQTERYDANQHKFPVRNRKTPLKEHFFSLILPQENPTQLQETTVKEKQCTLKSLQNQLFQFFSTLTIRRAVQ